MKNNPNKEIIEEFKKKQDIVNTQGGFLEYVEGYDPIDFDMESMEEWLEKALNQVRKEGKRDEREENEKQVNILSSLKVCESSLIPKGEVWISKKELKSL